MTDVAKAFQRVCPVSLGEMRFDTEHHILEQFRFPEYIESRCTNPVANRNKNIGVVRNPHKFEIGTAFHMQDGGFGSSVDVEKVVYGVGVEMHFNDSYNHEIAGNILKFTISFGNGYFWKEMLTMMSYVSSSNSSAFSLHVPSARSPSLLKSSTPSPSSAWL